MEGAVGVTGRFDVLWGQNEEGDDCFLGSGVFEGVVEARQGFDKDVGSLVAGLEPAGEEVVLRPRQVEVDVQVLPDQLVDFGFTGGVEAIQLLRRQVRRQVQTVARDVIRPALEQILRFDGADVGYGREDVGHGGGHLLGVVAVAEAQFPGRIVKVATGDVVVEIGVVGAQIARHLWAVRRVHRPRVDAPLPQQNQRQRRRPAVEVGHDPARPPTAAGRFPPAMADQLGHDVTENGRPAHLRILLGDADVARVDQLGPARLQGPSRRFQIE